MTPQQNFVLVTPVRNEVATIGHTLAAVSQQTVLPREWIIVSDGSTDGTDDLIESAARKNSWIRLLKLPQREGRSFAAVVHNTELGIRSLHCQDYEFLGLLDADLNFAPTYFEELLRCFERSPRLGIAGGVVVDPGHSREKIPRNRKDIPGAVQMFRRECFHSLGGLVPIPEGGWDAMTCAMARMHGFETRLVTDLVVDHLKPRNVSEGTPLRRLWQLGLRDYAMGYHPLFELVKCASRVTERPLILASVARVCGYFAGVLRFRRRVVPAHVVAFVRQEQRQRLTSFWRSETPAGA